MATISRTYLGTIKRLYYKKFLSAREIAIKLDVSIDAVYYFMRHHKLKRRTFSEENQIRFVKKQPSFIVKSNLSNRDQELKNIGVALYWGEGSKSKNRWTIDLANSDPSIIKTFLKFLREICGINESKIRVLLYCYANQDVNKLINFWSDLTNIPKRQFTKPYIRMDFKMEKMDKMVYGLIHIRYADKKLFLLIEKWINDLARKFAQVVP